MDKNVLIQTILDQAQDKLPKNLVQRWQYHQLTPLIDNKQVIIVSGVRRCGKSTLIQQLRLNANESDYYLNFDDDRLVSFQLTDFQMLLDVFIELYGIQSTFYFDEIQNISKWERFVRRLHNEGHKVFITGSNASLLSNELGTHLTGRQITLKLFPYSFKEFIRYKANDLLEAKNTTTTQKALIKKYFSEFKQQGGMPEYLESGQKQYLHALYENIIYKDIIVRNKLPQERPIKELVHYLASNNAKEFTYNSLKKLLGLGSSNTVAEYCHYLENSFLCFTVSRFAYSLKKQIHSSKKIYFIDQAIAKTVGYRFSEDQGRMLENIVFLQLKRQDFEIYFHKEDKECDFVIREGYQISQAIQVTVSLSDPKTKKREIEGLLEALTMYDLSKGLIITEDEDFTEIHEVGGKRYHIQIVPCWKWLLEAETDV
jgi:predicted AAA+ superfamily ATPase